MDASRVAPSAGAVAVAKPPKPTVVGKPYTGPVDGISHQPVESKTWRAFNKMLLPLLYRKNQQGTEKLPLSGPQVYCHDHPSTVESLFLADIIDRKDLRHIAIDYLFVGPVGPLLTKMGVFPVNRDNPSKTTIKHCTDVLLEGHGLSIAPSGGAGGEQIVLPQFHKGPAGFAIKGHAENIVPIEIFYHPDTEKRTGETLLGLAAAAAATAVGAAAVVAGAPAVVAIVGSMLLGSYLAGHIANKVVNPKEFFIQKFVKFGANTAAAIAGAVVAGAAAATAVVMGDATALTLGISGVAAAGLGTMGIAHAFRTRDVAEIVICDPIAVTPYAENYGRKEGITRLTEDLHRSIGHAKEKLTGVPYDDTLPKTVDFQKPNDPHPVGCPV